MSPREPHRGDAPPWELRLYIHGRTPSADQAIANLERICEAHLPGRWSLEIVDLSEAPERADEDQILAVPTLVRRSPPPPRRVIGDLSLTEQVLRGLEIDAKRRVHPTREEGHSVAHDLTRGLETRPDPPGGRISKE
jgi:circadian clock protein KaiB